ncbi:MAG TPA: ATP-binding cassette domain-containing protein [Steroidobacteraceae bacterium]
MVAHSARRRARYISVDLQRVRLSLGGNPVLRGIDWQIRPGQRWVLVGPNGAGKTQLLKLLAGDVWPLPGRSTVRRYRLDDVVFNDPYGIRQHIAYLGAERQDRYEHYRWNHRVESIVGTGLHRTEIPLDPLTAAARQQIARLLRRLRIEPLAHRRFLTLSYGERRLVLLARALASKPRLLLLDELFNGLDTRNRERVQDSLRSLSRSPLPWVLSSHRVADLPANATHLCRLERGRITLQMRLDGRARRALRRHERSAVVARKPASRKAGAPRATAIAGTAAAHDVLIALERASVWREGVAGVRNVTAQIRRGECWVVHGANGSGKSSLLQLLYGELSAASGGSVFRIGIEPGVSLELFKRRVGVVTPHMQLLQPRYLPVQHVVVSGIHASIGLSSAPTAAQRRRARGALGRIGAAALGARTVRELSYGQLRRVLFARALVNDPDMLLLDEPFASVDVSTRSVLRALIQRTFNAGVTIVMATHHRDEWPRATTHEIELDASRVVYCGPARPA